MARFATALRAFNGGELSRRMEGRSDLPAYAAGARVMENFIPLIQGPALRRSGSRYVAEVKDSDDLTVLIPFTVSTEASYIIEAGPLYFRFYTQEARLENPPGTPVEVVTPYTADQIEDVRWAQSADTLYLVHPSHAPRSLVRTSATTFTLDTLDFLDGPYLDIPFGGTLTPSATTGNITITASSTSGINDGQGFLSQDVGRFVRILQTEGSGDIDWGYAEITAINSTTNVDATVKSDFRATYGAGRWRLGAWYTDNYPRTVTFHEQRLWFGGAPNSIQRVDGSMTNDFPRFSPSGSVDDDTKYSGEEVYADNALDYTVSSNELNAILWARVLRTLQLGTSRSIFNMRASSNNEALTPTNVNVTEDDRTGSASVQPVAMSNVLMFVGNAERSLYGLSYSLEADAVQASNLTEFADHIFGNGVRRLAVAEQPHSIVWCARTDGTLAALVFRRAQRTAAWSRHLIGGSWPGRTSAVVESIAVSPETDQDQLWLVVKRKVNGSTVRYVEFMEESFRYLDPDQEIEDAFFADSGITLDGADASDPTTISGATQANPVVLSITGHPYSNGDSIRVTSVIGMTELNQRSFTVANATVNTVELSGVDGTAYTAYESGGEARKRTATITGLSHLEGETVQVLGDGASLPDATVASGQITLADPVSRAQIGLAAPAVYQSLPIEVPDPEGASQGKAKVFNVATVRFHETVGGEIGPSLSNLVDVLFRGPTDPMDKPLMPFSGDKRVTFPGGWDRDGLFTYRQSLPLPATLVMVNLSGQGGAR